VCVCVCLRGDGAANGVPARHGRHATSVRRVVVVVVVAVVVVLRTIKRAASLCSRLANARASQSAFWNKFDCAARCARCFGHFFNFLFICWLQFAVVGQRAAGRPADWTSSAGGSDGVHFLILRPSCPPVRPSVRQTPAGGRARRAAGPIQAGRRSLFSRPKRRLCLPEFGPVRPAMMMPLMLMMINMRQFILLFQVLLSLSHTQPLSSAGRQSCSR
jgi:hypothetical protein